MSRVYFNSPSGGAELLGSERAWLAHLAAGPAEAAWDLDGPGSFDRACAIMEMIPEVPEGQLGTSYLHPYWRQAQAQDEANKAVYAAWKPGQALGGHTDIESIRRFVDSLKLSLRVNGVDLDVAGVHLHSGNVDLNTALVAGSDPIQLAAKIHGWCESHCWVDGPDRAWLADVIDQGLDAGLYRPSAGWGEVQADLRGRDDEPVVMSYSVSDSFPNGDLGGWMPPWPDGVPQDWDALTEAQRQERDERSDAWYDLPANEQWTIAFEALQQVRPWAQLTPESLAEVTFSSPVTVYDLFASDRDERIRKACGIEAQPAVRSSATS